MNLEKDFAAHVRKHLGYFPVWQPGDAVAPGDIGKLEHGIFRRQASLSDIFPQLKLDIDQVVSENVTQFRSEDCSTTSIQASGTVPPQPGINANASVKLTFGTAGGAVFDALDCTEIYVKNLLDVRTYVEQNRHEWPKGFKLATRVTNAKRFMVMISDAAGASVDITGDATALASSHLAHASISTANERNVGYRKTGNGAILVGLYGFGWFGETLRVLSAAEPMHAEAEFKELPARDPIFD
jgi:hypothetical protein